VETTVTGWVEMKVAMLVVVTTAVIVEAGKVVEEVAVMVTGSGVTVEVEAGRVTLIVWAGN